MYENPKLIIFAMKINEIQGFVYLWKHTNFHVVFLKHKKMDIENSWVFFHSSDYHAYFVINVKSKLQMQEWTKFCINYENFE